MRGGVWLEIILFDGVFSAFIFLCFHTLCVEAEVAALDCEKNMGKKGMAVEK